MLNEIREEYDLIYHLTLYVEQDLWFLWNGSKWKPALACRTLIANYPDGKLTLLPMPAFELIKDLSVNTGKWMDAMSKRVESWIVDNDENHVDISKIEERMIQILLIKHLN